MKNNDYDYDNYNYTSPGPGPQNGGRPPRTGMATDTISWIVDIALIFLWFPAGLALTIAHGVGVDIVGKIVGLFRGADARTGTGAPGAYGAKSTSQRTGGADPHARHSTSQRKGGANKAESQKTPPKEETSAGAKTQQRSEKKTSSLRRADGGAKVKTVFGWILVAFGILGALGAVGTADALWTVLTGLAIALGGGSMLLSVALSRKRESQFRQCLKITGEAGLVDIAKLSRTMGWKGVAAERNLSDMIDRGYFGDRAYIDHERGLLVIRPEDMRDVYRAEDMAAEAKKAQAEKAEQQQKAGDMTEYERIVEAIRQADVDIDDEAMSEKIRRMQTITAAIFREVEAHPEKKNQIDRFLNYYLPTTLKLLNNYARIEEQGVTGQNMAKAKADIERIADTLVEGYEKQLDTLYRAEALDIAGDVSVIENMMKRDGLTGSKDFSPGQGETMGGH